LSYIPLLLADSSEAFLLQVLMQLVVIIGAARAGGWLFARFGQPQVVGEIATGLLLGPSCLGRLAPEMSAAVFATETAPVFSVLGQLGLIYLMFVVGLEFDFGHLRKVGRTAMSVASAGIILPFGLGAVLAWMIHSHVASGVSRPGFVLFLATALSITAIPILGRIMMEFGLTRTRLGVLTISAAAIDDAVGWILLAAVSSGVQGSFSAGPVLRMLALIVAFVAVVFGVIRPLVRRWMMTAFPSDAGEFRLAPFSVVLVLVLLSAIATNLIGVFSIFGPFVLGAALWDAEPLQRGVRHRIEEFVTAFFLPVFFTYTGLRTNIGLLTSIDLWLMADGGGGHWSRRRWESAGLRCGLTNGRIVVARECGSGCYDERTCPDGVNRDQRRPRSGSHPRHRVLHAGHHGRCDNHYHRATTGETRSAISGH
jgi:Kef-type K+ transport system membrane component KefB